MIRLENVSFAYDTFNTVIDRLNLAFREKKITTIIGPNGCGKSTAIKLSAGLLAPDEGRILYKEKDIASMKRKELAKKIAVVMQRFPGSHMTVDQLIMAGRYPHQSKLLKSSSEEDLYCVDKAVELTGCAEIRHKGLGQLSGGEIQRAYIAMALAQNTDVIFLDEPTSHLDLHVSFEIMELLMQLKTMQSKTFVMVLHDLSLALKYSDELVVINQGKIVSCGSCGEVRDSGVIQETLGIEMKCFYSAGKNYYSFDAKVR